MAALSGSNSQQAATAMYQLSQAISSGRVGLQDWNSVVNAGMGGKKLQSALATTATAMGKLGDNSVKLKVP
jgi:tape measure domain-containing protein